MLRKLLGRGTPDWRPSWRGGKRRTGGGWVVEILINRSRGARRGRGGRGRPLPHTPRAGPRRDPGLSAGCPQQLDRWPGGLRAQPLSLEGALCALCPLPAPWPGTHLGAGSCGPGLSRGGRGRAFATSGTPCWRGRKICGGEKYFPLEDGMRSGLLRLSHLLEFCYFAFQGSSSCFLVTTCNEKVLFRW